MKFELNKRCGGTLINRKNVLFAAHCDVQDFDYEYQGRIYSIPIELNQYYPTKESMYSGKIQFFFIFHKF
jgi:hypothetical protein